VTKPSSKTVEHQRIEAIDALEAWLANRAYLDNAGSYHEKKNRYDTRGPVAEWNVTARQVYRDSFELSAVARLSPEDRARWLDARLRGEDVPRICRTDLKRALAIIESLGPLLDVCRDGNVRLESVAALVRGVPPPVPHTFVGARDYPEDP
jgi:hypothetical protein